MISIASAYKIPSSENEEEEDYLLLTSEFNTIDTRDSLEPKLLPFIVMIGELKCESIPDSELKKVLEKFPNLCVYELPKRQQEKQ